MLWMQKKGLKPLSTVFKRLSAFSPMVSPIDIIKEPVTAIFTVSSFFSYAQDI